jgi:hypothetical protein
VPRTLDYSARANNPRPGAHRAITSIAALALALIIPIGFWIFDRLSPPAPANTSGLSAYQVLAGIACLVLSPLLALVGTLTAVFACVHNERPRPTLIALVLMITYGFALTAVVLTSR